jgi:hypothetical protein
MHEMIWGIEDGKQLFGVLTPAFAAADLRPGMQVQVLRPASGRYRLVKAVILRAHQCFTQRFGAGTFPECSVTYNHGECYRDAGGKLLSELRLVSLDGQLPAANCLPYYCVHVRFRNGNQARVSLPYVRPLNSAIYDLAELGRKLT